MRSYSSDVEVKDINWQMVWPLLPYLSAFRGRILLALLCLVFAKLASVGLPFVLKDVVDSLNKSEGVAATLALPFGLLLAYGALRFSNVLFSEIRDTIFGRVTEQAMRKIGLKVFRHLHNLSLDFHLNRRTGGLSRDIERGTTAISFLLRMLVFNVIPTLLEIGLVIILLWKNYSVWFALVVFSSVIAYVGYSIFTTQYRTKFIRRANKADSAANTRAIDSLLNYETVKYFTNEDYEAEYYDKELQTWQAARRKNRLSLFALNAGQAFIVAAGMTSAMVLAGLDVSSGEMTIGDFVLVNAFMMQIFMPLNFLGFVYREINNSMANLEKMFDLLAEKPQVSDAPHAAKLEVSRGELSFDKVCFNYDANRQILDNIQLTIPAKQKVAIVGSSGAGKSTIKKLVMRFYDCNSGSISIDGVDIKTVTQKSLRQAIGIVPQDTVLFNSSIQENIRYGRIDASDDEVMDAVRLAHLEDFIRRLPQGVHTLVGERGLKLSGGEKQRVAIARAILKRPPIMIFDEATSSLDSESEKGILEAMKDISKEQTTLVIAHRLSTISDADKIVVLDQGCIIEEGEHAQLLATNGKYAQMWRIQQEKRIEVG
ncbi:MAG: ABC transporter ATP-binding protein/permease [Cellvibrionaceae bacterium]|nr:ABC transporter ATP-binding protein/permease [Cellvibrionaceae bacterium]